MARTHNIRFETQGTRLRLFPQSPFLTHAPPLETVRVSTPPGGVGPGPEDDQMYVIGPLGKRLPYGMHSTPAGDSYVYLPPWTGPVAPPAMPDTDGHFDHIQVGTPQFEAAHLYGCTRRVLDIWQDYLGHPVRWHFRADFPRAELVLLPWFDNAQIGYGFLEVGSYFTAAGARYPFSLNFDVIAHEVGHGIIYSEVGLPRPDADDAEYYGFHESAADLVALVSLLHFDSVVNQLLNTTHGNLYTYNELNRFAELTDNSQIRIASNSMKLSDFAAGWSDEHKLAQPLTGAIFDLFIDLFHEILLDAGLIPPELEAVSDRFEDDPGYGTLMQALFDRSYPRDPSGFRHALLAARDTLGLYLAGVFARLSPDGLDYVEVGDALLATDMHYTGGRYQRQIRVNFRWREIGLIAIGPRLPKPGKMNHSQSARTVSPADAPEPRRLCYRDRMRIARRHPAPAALNR